MSKRILGTWLLVGTTVACGGVATSKGEGNDGAANLNGAESPAAAGSGSTPTSPGTGGASTVDVGNGGGFVSCGGPAGGYGSDNPTGFAGGGATSYTPETEGATAPCSCVDPTSPVTTRAECQSACVQGNLAGCNWGNQLCAVGLGGEACGCTPVGLLQPDGDLCYVTGQWHTHSAPWNGMSTDARIEFRQDGTIHGTPEFSGKWSLEGTKLSVFSTVGQDMTCEFPDYWTLTFSDDCNTAPLVPIGSGCTGARRYLDWDVTLTRF